MLPPLRKAQISSVLVLLTFGPRKKEKKGGGGSETGTKP